MMKTIIELKADDSAKVTTTSNDGTISTKVISLASLCNVLADVNRTQDINVPPGCRKIYENKSKAMYVFIAPSFIGKAVTEWRDSDVHSWGLKEDCKPSAEEVRNRYPNYKKDYLRVFDIPYPATAVGVLVNKEKDGTYRFLKMYCYVVSNIMESVDNMQAYYWPFTNVYSSGECCIGRIPTSFPTIESLASIPGYIFRGVCNHDLTGPNAISAPSNGSVGKVKDTFEMLVKVAGKTEFPTEYLKQMGNLGSIMKNIVSNV